MNGISNTQMDVIRNIFACSQAEIQEAEEEIVRIKLKTGKKSDKQVLEEIEKETSEESQKIIEDDNAIDDDSRWERCDRLNLCKVLLKEKMRAMELTTA